MNINPTNVNNLYKSSMKGIGAGSGKAHSAEQDPEKKKEVQYDTVTISAKGSKTNDVSRLANGIAKEVDAVATADRIESIKQAIQNDDYKIDSQMLADAIMNRAQGGFDRKI